MLLSGADVTLHSKLFPPMTVASADHVSVVSDDLEDDFKSKGILMTVPLLSWGRDPTGHACM